MADRTMIWHIPNLPAVVPTYYADRDYELVALRIYAERSPDRDLFLDILDDGVSIMNANTRQTMAFRADKAYIEYGTLVGTFSLGETINGGSSSASARVYQRNVGELILIDPSATNFTVAETITGGSSGATAVVHAYVKQRNEYLSGTVAGQSHAGLRKNANSEEAAQDFRQGAEIREGSWISLSLLDAAGASNITVQLELDALERSNENRPSRTGAK